MKNQWLQIYDDLKRKGKLYSPRGQKTLEIENYMFEGDPYNRFANFAERKLSLNYIKKEFLWYLSGDRDNTDIVNASKFWDKIKNSHSPLWNSNYGYYIFKEQQLQYCFDQLREDKDSRQAVIIINRPDVMMSESKDKICTYSISFRIRNNKLNMSVNMRSNDFILGTQIDYFQFAAVQEILLHLLRARYDDLEMGTYSHKADSFHIYERHFQLMEDILGNNGANYTEIEYPKITSTYEAYELLNNNIDRHYQFSNWILDFTK